MRKLVFIALFAVAFLDNAQAQARLGASFSGGIITARTESVYVGNVSDYATHEVKFTGASPVFNAGVTYQNKIGWLYMQPSLMYSRYSLDYMVEAFQRPERGITEVMEKYQFIDLHAIAGIHANNFRLGFGPIFHIKMGFDSGLDNVPTYRENKSTLTTGFAGTVGYDMYPMSFDLRYEGSFISFGDHIFLNNAKSNLEGGPDQLSLMLTYSFGL